MSYENLTQLQKIALKGELAAIFSFAHSDADLKLKIYRILKESDEQYKPLFLDAIKESVSLEEEEIMRLLFMGSIDEVPLSLWIEKTVEDIKYYLTAPDLLYRNFKLALDKKEERKSIITSAFISFARRVIMTSPEAVLQLINKILRDDELEFLFPPCIYLQEGCADIKNFKYYSSEISENILKCEFDPRDILSLGTETDCLNNTNKNDDSEDIPRKSKQSDKIITVSKDIVINGNTQKLSQEELSQFLGEQVMMLFNSIHSIEEPKNSEGKLYYVVQKEFNNTDIKTDIRKCNSEKEALEFIEEIKKAYPELQRTCKFVICKKVYKD